MHRHRLLPLFLVALVPPAAAQNQGIPVFSIGWYGPSIGTPNSFTGFPISEGDLLVPQPLTPAFGPLPPPGIVESAGALAPAGLNLSNYIPCFGHPAYTPCKIEVDALSHGLDPMFDCTPGTPSPTWMFSVQYRALGWPGGFPPDVASEAVCQDEGADVFAAFGAACGPLPPTSAGGFNGGVIDGDGMANCTGSGLYPGLGLIEIPPPNTVGDNLDAIDLDVPDRFFPSTTCTYFSLDSGFVDPPTGFNNTSSASAQGFVGGDVLVTCPSCSPALYASAAQLGLDFFGADSDDLDALVLRENGIPGYQRSQSPYDWVTGASDMLFFSVRRGSAVIGFPDAIFGQPIEPGDILIPTGPLGTQPGIFVAAENLGLMTGRILLPAPPPDDLDALDLHEAPSPGQGYCFGDGSGPPCPCGNSGATGRGCANSTHAEGALLWAHGNPSISFDTLQFTVSGIGSTVTNILMQGTATNPGVPFGDGLRCVGGTLRRLYTRSALCGNRSYGWQVPGDAPISVVGGITIPQTAFYQVWYRDPNPTFCTPAVFNMSSGYVINWVP